MSHSQRTSTLGTRSAGGFTLVEVMVAMAVIAIGLLGIAKMQALALSSTTVASERSLAALEASSLGASMHANRAYWAAGGLLPAAGVTVTGATVNDAVLGAAQDCTTASGNAEPICDSVQLAAADLQLWAASLAALLPNDTATVICTNVVGVPVTCTIQISWAEKAVAVNQQEASQAGQNAQFQNPTYTLYVEP